MLSDRIIVIILVATGITLITMVLKFLLPRVEVFIIGIIISIIIICGIYIAHWIFQDHATQNNKNYA